MRRSYRVHDVLRISCTDYYYRYVHAISRRRGRRHRQYVYTVY